MEPMVQQVNSQRFLRTYVGTKPGPNRDLAEPSRELTEPGLEPDRTVIGTELKIFNFFYNTVPLIFFLNILENNLKKLKIFSLIRFVPDHRFRQVSVRFIPDSVPTLFRKNHCRWLQKQLYRISSSFKIYFARICTKILA